MAGTKREDDMTEKRKDHPESPQAGKKRKPYTKPTVTSEPIFETLALACGKMPGQGGVCNAAPKLS